MLCLAALLTGGASGAVVIAVQRHAGRVTHDAVALKKVFSWLAIGPAISNFIGPFSTGLLIDHANFGGEGSTMGYRVAFGLLALVPVLAWSWVRHTQELPPVRAPIGGRSSMPGTCCATAISATCCWSTGCSPHAGTCTPSCCRCWAMRRA